MEGSESKLEKEDFKELESIVSKKLRNKKKKMDKIIQTENKIVAKEITPTQEQLKMVSSKAKVEGQIKELEGMKRELHKGSQKILTKHNMIVKELQTGEANKENTIRETLEAVADALLVNLLQNEYNVKNLVGDEEKVGLEAIMVPVKSLLNPPADQLIYDRAKDCFMEIFSNFVKGTEDLIPGSDTTYSKLLNDLQSIPASVKSDVYRLDAEDTAADEVHAETHEEVKAAEPTQAAQVPQSWNEIDEQDDQDDDVKEEEKEVEEETQEKPTIEELVEEDVKNDMVQGVREHMKSKTFIDEDGFTHVKPHDRSDFEHNYLRGRGRRGRGGKKGRQGETDRFKVRGGKGPRGGYRGRGRGGRPHHDKHDVDETGKKVKTAHGKHPHWSKGEVRVPQNLS